MLYFCLYTLNMETQRDNNDQLFHDFALLHCFIFPFLRSGCTCTWRMILLDQLHVMRHIAYICVTSLCMLNGNTKMTKSKIQKKNKKKTKIWKCKDMTNKKKRLKCNTEKNVLSFYILSFILFPKKCKKNPTNMKIQHGIY